MNLQQLTALDILFDAPCLRTPTASMVIDSHTTRATDGNLLDVDWPSLAGVDWTNTQDQLIALAAMIGSNDIDLAFDLTMLTASDRISWLRALTVHVTGEDPWTQRDDARQLAIDATGIESDTDDQYQLGRHADHLALTFDDYRDQEAGSV